MHCKSQMPLEKAWLYFIHIIQTNGKQSLGKYSISLLRKQVIIHEKLLFSLGLSFEEWWLCSYKQTRRWFLAVFIIITSSERIAILPLGFPSFIAIIHCHYHQRYDLVFFEGATYFSAKELFSQESVYTHLEIRRELEIMKQRIKS